MKRYLFSYRFEGHQYSFDVPAESAGEAIRRVKQMTFAKYDGELMITIKVVPNWLARLFGR